MKKRKHIQKQREQNKEFPPLRFNNYQLMDNLVPCTDSYCPHHFFGANPRLHMVSSINILVGTSERYGFFQKHNHKLLSHLKTEKFLNIIKYSLLKISNKACCFFHVCELTSVAHLPPCA